MKRVLLTTLINLSIIFAHAQQINFDNNRFIPPSPHAYSIAKYGDVPVSYFTGIPNISIPICNVTDHSLSIPISLVYYAGGIKVDEVSSFVGLGWSMEAGGVITRVIHGRGEYLSNSGELLPRRINNINYTSASGKTPYQFLIDNSFQSLAAGQFDSEPDVFYYNFAGKSGKFYFDSAGQAILEKQDDIKVQWIYSSDRVERFLITDEKGNRYEFNDAERTFYGGNDGSLISSWFLSKISTPTDNQIQFEYLNAGSANDLARTYSSTCVKVIPTPLNIYTPNNVPATNNGTQEIRLHKVISSSGFVEFKYKDSSRLDLPNAGNLSVKALDEIIISATDGSALKKYKLFSSYFEANNTKKYTGASSVQLSYLNYRLRLDSVQELSGDTQTSMPPYRFKYLGDENPSTNDSYTLPYRLSPEQDHWGYYNNSGNIHLLPGNAEHQQIPVDMTVSALLSTVEEIENGFSGTNRSMVNGANRSPDTAAMKAGMLKEIVYPTGGSSEFMFEANYLSGNFGGVRIKQILDIANNKKVKEKNYEYTTYYNDHDPNTDYYRDYHLNYGFLDQNNQPEVIFPHLAQLLGLPSTASEAGVNPNSPSAEWIRISATPQAILGSVSSNGYSSVSVLDGNNGKVEYDYNNFEDYYSYENASEYDLLLSIFENQRFTYLFAGQAHVNSEAVGSADWPYPEIFNNGWRRGTLNSVTWISSIGKIVKTEKYHYTSVLQNAVPAGKVIALAPETGNGYVTSRYFLPHGYVKLDSIVTTTYDINGENPIQNQQSFYYDNPNYTLASRRSEKDSRGNVVWTQTLYPPDYSTGDNFIDSMNDAHLVTYPVEEVVYKKINGVNKVSSGKIIRYNGFGLKKEEQLLEISSPIELTSFKFSNRLSGILPPSGLPQEFQPDDRYKPSYYFDEYDEFGNNKEIHKSNNLYESYKWGYSNQYPVMRVVNARSHPAVYGIRPQSESVSIPGNPSITFSTSGGAIEIRLVTNVGYIYKLQYSLTGPESHSGIICASGTNTSCSSPGTVSFNNMPAGTYTFLISDYESNGIPNKLAVITYDANVIVTPESNDFFYESFEEQGNASAIPFAGDKYHTGNYSVPYHISTSDSYLIDYRYLDGGIWKFKALPFSNDMTLSGAAIDEVRIYPSKAEMTTYTYKPLVGMISETDPSGKTNFYEYDGLGRLKLIKDENGKIIKTFSYKYTDH